MLKFFPANRMKFVEIEELLSDQTKRSAKGTLRSHETFIFTFFKSNGLFETEKINLPNSLRLCKYLSRKYKGCPEIFGKNSSDSKKNKK